MNPAHILRRLYTDPSIGRGLPASRLDEDSWRAAADKFYAEGFGLCMKWARTGSIADFAAEVINHAGAVVYTSRRTGKIVLKAIRDDYDINDLPLYTSDTGLLGFDDDEASSQTGGINEVVVDGETGLLVDPHLSDEPPHDPVSPARFERGLADAINRIANDPDLCQRMAQAGRERVERHYSWHSIAQQTYDLYRRLRAQRNDHP